MTEVKRYHLTETGLVEGESLGRLSVVLAADFQRVTAERDALQQRLTAADERADKNAAITVSTAAELAWQESDDAELRKRVDVLEGLLRKLWHVVPNGYKSDIDAALKPAEGGGGDEAVNEG